MTMTNQFEDRKLICIDCEGGFTWTAGEQQFFADKELKNIPKRCKGCKRQKTERIAAVGLNTAARNTGEKVEVEVKCDDCGEQTTVPFYPTQGRPVYCYPCHQSRKGSAVA